MNNVDENVNKKRQRIKFVAFLLFYHLSFIKRRIERIVVFTVKFIRNKP